MPITNIDALIEIKTRSNTIAKIIHAAIDPDNLTEPPMTFHSTCESNIIIYYLKNVKRIETMLATLIDLLDVYQATESVLKSHNFD
ncbi:MAG: hypothetical protein ACFFB2_10940 [Promethearchaeota archaeon]